jgi:acyl-CoA synthetase (AMP-forming)/AMP-acid ligase II
MGAPVDMAMAAAHTPAEEQGIALIPVPLFHVTGLLAVMVRVFYAGTQMVFMRRWSVPDAVKLIVKNNIKMLSGVPAITTAILQSGLLPKDYHFDALSYGGAPPPKRLGNDVKTRFPAAFM